MLHLPPGTSKWNKIEHRLFSAITMNWRGRPLVSHEVIIETISAVTTRTGLKVTAVLDTSLYPKGIRIPDKDMKAFEARHLQRHEFHGNWNLWPITHKFHYAPGRIMRTGTSAGGVLAGCDGLLVSGAT